VFRLEQLACAGIRANAATRIAMMRSTLNISDARRSGAVVTVLSGYDLGFCPRWPRCGPNDATKLNDLSRSAPKSDQSDIRNSEVMTK
jgi:hypothetical protein